MAAGSELVRNNNPNLIHRQIRRGGEESSSWGCPMHGRLFVLVRSGDGLAWASEAATHGCKGGRASSIAHRHKVKQEPLCAVHSPPLWEPSLSPGRSPSPPMPTLR